MVCHAAVSVRFNSLLKFVSAEPLAEYSANCLSITGFFNIKKINSSLVRSVLQKLSLLQHLHLLTKLIRFSAILAVSFINLLAFAIADSVAEQLEEQKFESRLLGSVLHEIYHIFFHFQVRCLKLAIIRLTKFMLLKNVYYALL